MIIQPGSPLPGSFRVILAHHYVPQPQSVGFKYRNDPAESDQRRYMRIPVQVGRAGIWKAGSHIDLSVACVRRESSHDAPVKVGEVAVARHIDAHGIGSLHLQRSIYTYAASSSRDISFGRDHFTSGYTQLSTVDV